MLNTKLISAFANARQGHKKAINTDAQFITGFKGIVRGVIEAQSTLGSRPIEVTFVFDGEGDPDVVVNPYVGLRGSDGLPL